MALQFIFGGAGAGKSYYIYNNIIQQSIENPQKQYLILVPEQFADTKRACYHASKKGNLQHRCVKL